VQTPVKVEIPRYVREWSRRSPSRPAPIVRSTSVRVRQRLPITTIELVVSNAERKSAHQWRNVVVPRVPTCTPRSVITGKFELE